MDGVLLVAHPAPRHPRIGFHQQSTMQSLRNGADEGTTTLPGDGIQFGRYSTSLTEKLKSWATNCAWLFAAFRGTSQPSLLCKWKERASNRASYCLITSLQAPCTFLQPVNLFFIRCLQTFWREQKTVSKRDGASVTERDPSPSSSAYHEGVTPQAWRCSKSTSL